MSASVRQALHAQTTSRCVSLEQFVPASPLAWAFRTQIGGIDPAEAAGYRLPPHEIRLLRLLVECQTYKTAATELNVSANIQSAFI